MSEIDQIRPSSHKFKNNASRNCVGSYGTLYKDSQQRFEFPYFRVGSGLGMF
jgi:hypothetical protein